MEAGLKAGVEPRSDRTSRTIPLSRPSSVPEPAYFFGLFGPVALGASLAVQALLIAVLLVPSRERPLDTLSGSGLLFVYPEWDIPVYLAAIALGLGSGAVFAARHRQGWLRGTAPATSLLVGRSTELAGLAVVTSALSLMAFTSLQDSVLYESATYDPQQLGPVGAYPVIFLALLALTVYAGLGGRLPALATWGGDRRFRWLAADQPTMPVSIRWRWWEALVPAAVAALIYVPSWRQVAGHVFLKDTFLHWDYFAMGPALAFREGLALGTEVHSAYGLGWPLAFNLLDSWVELSYGRLIQVGSIYACLWLLGLYLLLRKAVRRPVLAVAGLILAMLPFFVGLDGLLLWLIPNVSILRWPMDVWTLIALLGYLRSGKRAWAVTAGALTGLAIFTVIDSGSQLAAAVTFCWMAVLIRHGGRDRFKDVLWSAAAALLVLAAGLMVAARGDIFTVRFLTGWLEAPLVFGAGFGMNPIITSAHPLTVLGFCSVVLVYLAVAGYTIVRLLHGRGEPVELLAGTVAVYGLLVLVKFAGQSGDLILPRTLFPAAILGPILIDRALDRLPRRRTNRTPARISRRWGAVAAAGTVLATVILGMLPGNPLREGIARYPNLLAPYLSPVDRFPETGICLIAQPKDVCGLPRRMAGTVSTFQAVVGELRQIKRSGHDFAVMDETGSLLYWATGTAPFGRYSRIFTSTPTTVLVRKVTASFEDDLPDYVLNRAPVEPGTPPFESWNRFGMGPVPDAAHIDLWNRLNDVIHENYEPAWQRGPYELWERKR